MRRNFYFIIPVLFVAILFVGSSQVAKGQGTGIWMGAKDTFTKANYADYTKAANQDRITDSVWITRQNDRGIFNIKVSSGYSNNSSPLRTKWAMGNTKNLSALSFRDWESTNGSSPPSMVNKDMVLMIVKDSIYIDLMFTSWTSGGQGGGFTYIRSTDCRTFDTISIVQCDSVVSPSKKHVWRKSGVYYDTLSNSTNCDSIITCDVEVLGKDTGTIFMSGCGVAVLPLTKTQVTKTGTYYDVLKNSTVCGRDSVLECKVFIYTVPTKTMSMTGCDSVISPSGKQVWDSSGQYTDILPASGSCDTVVTVNVTIHKSVVTQISETACSQYVSATKKVYTKTGRYYDTLQTTLGCDSIIDLDLIINKATYGKLIDATCKVSYTSPSGNHVWNKSGFYIDTLVNAAGCDSFLDVTLTVKPSNSTIDIKSCEPWSSPSGKYIYDVSGTYLDTLTTPSNCDSVVTIDFTRVNPTTAMITIPEAINRYHSPSGKYIWTANGTYTDTIPNSEGCDSVITFDLTVKDFSLDVTKEDDVLKAEATGVNYQWLDCDDNHAEIIGRRSQSYKVTKKGSYAVEISNEWNADTSECVQMNLSVGTFEDYQISMYPNPNHGSFTIDIPDAIAGEKVIEVYNSQGGLVYTFNTSLNVIHLNLDDAAFGLYFVHVQGDGFSARESVMVE